MTILNGEVAPSLLGQSENPRLSHDMSEHEVDYWPTHASQIRYLDKTFLSTYPYNLLVEAGWEIQTDARTHSYKDNLYYRVHVRPRVMDFGNLINTEVADLVVWNANFEPVFLQSLSAVSQPGVTVAFPTGVTAPYTIKPTEELLLTVTAFIDGPPVINGEFDLVIDGITYPVSVIGRRILLWPFRRTGSPLSTTPTCSVRGRCALPMVTCSQVRDGATSRVANCRTTSC